MTENYDIYGFSLQPSGLTSNENKNQFRIQQFFSERKSIFIIIGILIVLSILLISLFSAFTAWNCYIGNLNSVRYVKTFMAFCFPYIYLPYIFLLRVVLGQSCS